MALNQRAEASARHQSSCAILLAGQMRSLAEPDTLRALRRHVLDATNSSVFAHLNIEDNSSPSWAAHMIDHSNRSDLGVHASRVHAVRRSLNPIYMRIEPDWFVVQHPRWVGSLRGQPGEQDILFFRWLILREAMEAEETARGRKFKLVLRLRPDTVPLCELPRDLASWGADALISDDIAVLMRREVASVALDIYSHAEALPACRLKFELCVPALLESEGFSVFDLRPTSTCGGAFAIVRSQSFCDDPASLSYPPNMRCGRTQLSRVLLAKEPLPRCGDVLKPRRWAQDELVTHYMQQRKWTQAMLRQPAQELPFSKYCRSCRYTNATRPMLS